MIVGVVPAAGLGTRLPDRIGSKELVEIGGAPMIERIVGRLEVGGCERIVVVTRPEKIDVIRYARSRGLDVLEARPATAGDSIALGAGTCEDDEIVAFGFPDTIWEPVAGFRPLIALVVNREPLALGLFETDEPERADVVELDATGRVVGIVIKSPTPPSNLVWGCGAARAHVLRLLAGTRQPGELFTELAVVRPVAAVRLGRIIDLGTPSALEAGRSDPLSMDRA